MIPSQLWNCALLLGEAVLYFGVMATLFRLRHRIGIGLFLCALGVMHFLETYLASVFYVALPFGIVSPGSTVLFSGKLVMLLLLYIKEDASAVRQPIYGLLFGNTLMVALVLLLRLHVLAPLPDGKLPDIGFVDQMGWLMVWGTLLLYIDALAIILLYEKLRRSLARHFFLRMVICAAVVLTFDQLGFFLALHIFAGAPMAALVGGWVAKMGAAVIFSVCTLVYLRWFETPALNTSRRLGDIFEVLTYRERYEALVEHAGRDGLTGLLNRGRFEVLGQSAFDAALRTNRPLSLLMVDIDHFKSINDRFGHAAGDHALRTVAAVLSRSAGQDAQVFRIGGEEFAVLCSYPHELARLIGERIRLAVAGLKLDDSVDQLSVSIGVASMSRGTLGIAALFAQADQRLYEAKKGGRDRVVGEEKQEEMLPSGYLRTSSWN